MFSNGDTYEGEYMNSQRNGDGKKKQQTVRQILLLIRFIYLLIFLFFAVVSGTFLWSSGKIY